jgi:hypothetical protein
MAADLVEKVHWNEQQRSINDYLPCEYGKWNVTWQLLFITNGLAAFLGTRVNNTVTAWCGKYASLVYQRFLELNLGNLAGDCLHTSQDEVLTTFKPKNNVTHFLPHGENECQQSIIDIWSCILGSLTCNWLQSCINKILTAFRSKISCGIIAAPSWKSVSMECEWFYFLHFG